MHLLRNSKPIPMGSHGVLEPGEWLCHDQNAAELMLMGERGTSSISEYPDYDWAPTGVKNLIVRSGAIGDLLYLTPAIAAFKAAHPDTPIALSCFQKHHEVVCDLGIDLLPYPVPRELALKYHVVTTLENLVETNHVDHATDCFAKALGVEVTDYRPIFKLTELEIGLAAAKFPRIDSRKNSPIHPMLPKVGKRPRIRVGIQPLASTSNRCYPLALWLGVIELLTKQHNCEIFLFGHYRQIPPLLIPTTPDKNHVIPVPHCTNLTEEPRTFRQSAAILSTCDLFVGVDSCFLPLCHALDIPAVGLYAAFDWKTRTSKAPMTWALTGLGPCAPCNWLKHAGKDFPPDQECSKTRFCHVLASITPERIVAKLLSLPRDKA